MNVEAANVKTFFNSIQVHLSDLWLESCIAWCKTENLPPNYTQKELQSKVYEQWLLLDLRDIEVQVLPPDLINKKLYTLNGNFCLQMMKIVDISKPKLWQLQKIRNSNALTRDTLQDSEIAGTGKRLLQLTLTDGVQEIEAMEYKPIARLNLNLPPGTKIRILGPIIVRRGRLMLEPHNVKILGGEVEELLITNAAENVLARALGMPENPNPGHIEEKKLAVEKEDKNEGYCSNTKIPKLEPKPPPNKQIIELTEEEEMLMAQEFDTPMEPELPNQNLNQYRAPDLFENQYNDDDFEIEREISQSRTSTQKSLKAEISLDDDEDVFNNIDLDAHLNEIDRNRRGDSLPKPNILTIARLLEKRNFISKGVFKIKAKFKSVEEKLTMADNAFKLVIRVEDSSGELVAKVHSDVVSEFAEISADEIINLKNDVLGKNQVAVQKMMQAILKVKEKLLKLDNILVVQIEKDQVPLIKKIQ